MGSEKGSELKPVAAIGDPPAGHADRDRGEQGPPEGQRHIRKEPPDREADPENLALHAVIVAGEDRIAWR